MTQIICNCITWNLTLYNIFLKSSVSYFVVQNRTCETRFCLPLNEIYDFLLMGFLILYHTLGLVFASLACQLTNLLKFSLTKHSQLILIMPNNVHVPSDTKMPNKACWSLIPTYLYETLQSWTSLRIQNWGRSKIKFLIILHLIISNMSRDLMMPNEAYGACWNLIQTNKI